MSEPSPVPSPAAGLHREVEVMCDGRRRITYYSREIEYEATSGLARANEKAE